MCADFLKNIGIGDVNAPSKMPYFQKKMTELINCRIRGRV